MDRQPWSVFTDYNKLPWRQAGFIDEIRTLNQIKQSGPQTDPQTVPSCSYSDVFWPKWKVFTECLKLMWSWRFRPRFPPLTGVRTRASERASGATHWPLQNLAMASHANEKQRARRTLGGDPFKAPRRPPPVSSTGPQDESSFTAEDDGNTGIDSWLVEREIQHVNVLACVSDSRLWKRTRVSGLDYSWRLHSIKKNQKIKGDLY